MTSQNKKTKGGPLRIGIDARLAYRRGVGTYAANLILALAKTDTRNEYFIFNAPDNMKRQVSNQRFQWVDLSFANAAFYEQVLLPRAAAAHQLDFLHYVDNSATAFSGFPFVLTLHDTMHTRPLSQVRPHPTFRQWLVHLYKRWAISRSAPRAKAILTVSEFSKGRIVEEMGIRKEKVFVTPEGVDTQLFNGKFKNASKLFKILVHGAADERKNIPNTLKAVKLLADQGKEFQLVIIGMDEDELKCTDYIRQVTDLGLGRQVEWAGNVPTEMLPNVYAEADLFLYPSRLEGFGLPLLEAFACGVPVVAANAASLPEVAWNAALMVDPESPEAIAKALKDMMERKGLRKMFAQRGFQRVREFTWEKTAKLTLKVYEQLEF